MGSQPNKPQRPQYNQTIVIQQQRPQIQNAQGSQFLQSNTYSNPSYYQSQQLPQYPIQHQYSVPNIQRQQIPQQSQYQLPQPPLQRAQTTPQIKPKVIANELCVEQVKLVNDTIEFNVYAITPCKVQLFVQCKEQQNIVNQSFQGIVEKQLYDEIQLDQSQTTNLQYKSRFKVTHEILSYNKSDLGVKYWKFILLISNTKMMMIYYYDYEDHHLKLQKQKFQSTQHGIYEVQEIYGINDTNLLGQFRHQESDGDCIICLNEKIDTIIMPCRHMCLCGTCAKEIMDKKEKMKREPHQMNAPDFNICPICREAIENFIKLQRVS